MIPTSAAPITFFLRESAEWLHHALEAKSVDDRVLAQCLSPEAQQVRALLAERDRGARAVSTTGAGAGGPVRGSDAALDSWKQAARTESLRD